MTTSKQKCNDILFPKMSFVNTKFNIIESNVKNENKSK